MKSLHWYDIDRMALPDVLFSVNLNELKSKSTVALESNYGQVTFGYHRDPIANSYAQPAVILLEESKVAETISWVNAHSPESFPFSQFARTLTKEDYKQAVSSLSNDIDHPKTEIWPCIIIGELLALGDSETSLESLPLSRAQATFTNVISKSHINYTSSKIYSLCIERLSKLEKNPRFVGRTIHVEELNCVWTQVILEKNVRRNLEDLIDIPTSKVISHDLFSPSANSKIDLRNYKNLLSDSAEDRILEYRRLLKEIDTSQTKLTSNDIASIAISAFLVGRSTSHLFLLKEIGKIAPALYVWFGYIAGIMGPKYWTLEWSRASKGIEKGLRTNFNWEDPPQCDLSWTEYDWLDKAYKLKDPFSEIPKLLPKVLSLEIVPGACCQLRLSLSQSQQETIQPKPQTDESDKLRKSLKEFIDLADRVRNGINMESQVNNTKSDAKRATRSNQRTDNVKKIENVSRKNSRQKKTDS